MATITFDSSDPRAEIQAVLSTLTLWLRELPAQPPRPAKARFKYDVDGLVRLIVEVDE